MTQFSWRAEQSGECQCQRPLGFWRVEGTSKGKQHRKGEWKKDKKRGGTQYFQSICYEPSILLVISICRWKKLLQFGAFYSIYMKRKSGSAVKGSTYSDQQRLPEFQTLAGCSLQWWLPNWAQGPGLLGSPAWLEAGWVGRVRKSPARQMHHRGRTWVSCPLQPLVSVLHIGLPLMPLFEVRVLQL